MGSDPNCFRPDIEIVPLLALLCNVVHKLEAELGWKPVETLGTGIRKTAEWSLAKLDGVATVQSGAHKDWWTRPDALS